MDRVATMQQYRALMADVRQKGFKATNCYFLPDTVNQMICGGTLFYQFIDDGLLLLDDNVEFYRCYYFLPEQSEPSRVVLDRKAVIEFPFTGDMKEKQIRQIRMIEAMGFRLGRESGLMSASCESVARSSHTEALSPCQAAIPEDVTQILDLLTASFDPLYAFLPSEETLTDSINKGLVLVTRNGNDLSAVLVSGFEKNMACLRQIAVASKYRGKGLGRALMEGYHAKYLGQVSGFQHWVDLKNSRAIHLYLSLGYAFTLRRANEYIMNEQEDAL